jgi:hypothetical protein
MNVHLKHLPLAVLFLLTFLTSTLIAQENPGVDYAQELEQFRAALASAALGAETKEYAAQLMAYRSYRAKESLQQPFAAVSAGWKHPGSDEAFRLLLQRDEEALGKEQIREAAGDDAVDQEVFLEQLTLRTERLSQVLSGSYPKESWQALLKEYSDFSQALDWAQEMEAQQNSDDSQEAESSVLERQPVAGALEWIDLSLESLSIGSESDRQRLGSKIKENSLQRTSPGNQSVWETVFRGVSQMECHHRC